MEIKSIKKLLLSFILGLLIIYILFGLLLFIFQKSLIYFPNNQDFSKCGGFSDYEKLNFNGTRFYFNNYSSEQVIVVYHGNAGSACDRSAYRSLFESSNKSIIFVEYSGYSNSKEKPSKSLILEDADNINHFLKQNNFKEVIVFGESIGTGPASYHANLAQVNRLILVSPFDRLSDVAQSKFAIYPISLLLTENYDNEKMLKDFQGKLLILHGSQDTIISCDILRALKG